MVCPFAFIVLLPGLQPLAKVVLDGTMTSRILRITGHSTFFWWSFLGILIATAVLFYLSHSVKRAFEASASTTSGLDSFWTPDSSFGKSMDEIDVWFQKIGPSGRDAYRIVAWADLVLYVACWGAAVTSLLSIVVNRIVKPSPPNEKNGDGDGISTMILRNTVLLPIYGMLMDVCETSAFLHAVTIYPEQQSPTLRSFAPAFNKACIFFNVFCSTKLLLAFQKTLKKVLLSPFFNRGNGYSSACRCSQLLFWVRWLVVAFWGKIAQLC
jgi:hypothetical protein